MANYDMGTAHGRIRIEYEGDGFERTERGFQRVGQSAGNADSKFGDFAKKVGTITSLLVAFGQSAGAAAGAAAAAVGVTAAAFTAAGAAVGAFALAAKGQLADVGKSSQQADKLAAAQQEAAQKTRIAEHLKATGSKEWKTAMEEAGVSQKKAIQLEREYKDSLSQLPPATKNTALAFTALKKEYKAWSDSLAPETMPIFTKGINILRDILPKLTPLVRVAASAFDNFLTGIQAGVQSGTFDRVVAKITQIAQNALPDLLQAAKNIGQGLGNLFGPFLSQSGSVSDKVELLSAKFLEWSSSVSTQQGIQAFFQNMKTNGPQIMAILGQLAEVVKNLIIAFGPFTGVSLKTTEAMAQLVAAIPIPVLKVLITTITLATVAFRIYTVATGIATGVQKAFGTAANPGPLRKLWSALTTATTAMKNFVLWIGRGIVSLVQMAARGIASAVAALVRFTAQVVRAGVQVTILAAKMVAQGIASFASTLATAITSMISFGLQVVRATISIVAQTAALVAQKVILGAIKIATLAWAAAQWILNSALLANPITLIIVGIVALIAAIVLAWQHSETFRNIVTSAFNAIKSVVMGAINFVISFVKNNWQLLVGILGGPIGIAIALIIKHWDRIKSIFLGAINAVVGFVRNNWRSILNLLTAPIQLAIAGVQRAWSAIRGAFNSAVSSLASMMGSLRSRISSGISAVVNSLNNLKNRIFSIFSGAGRWLINAGKNIIQGLINGIVAMFNKLKSTLSSVTKLIPSWKGPARRDKRLLTANGRLIMASLIKGLRDYLPRVQAALGQITSKISVTAPTSIPAVSASTVTNSLPPSILRDPNYHPPATTSGAAAQSTTTGLVDQMVSAMQIAGVGMVSLDGEVISQSVSRNQGRISSAQRRIR